MFYNEVRAIMKMKNRISLNSLLMLNHIKFPRVEKEGSSTLHNYLNLLQSEMSLLGNKYWRLGFTTRQDK